MLPLSRSKLISWVDNCSHLGSQNAITGFRLTPINNFVVSGSFQKQQDRMYESGVLSDEDLYLHKTTLTQRGYAYTTTPKGIQTRNPIVREFQERTANIWASLNSPILEPKQGALKSGYLPFKSQAMFPFLCRSLSEHTSHVSYTRNPFGNPVA